MRDPKAVLVLSLAIAICAGCSASAPALTDSADDGASGGNLFPDGMLLTIPGAVDDANRFLPAVSISSAIVDADHKRHFKPCTGVLIHPRLVLTAGHCVCLERRPTQAEQAEFRNRARKKPAKRTAVLTRAAALEGAGVITSIIDNKSLCAESTIVTTIRSSPQKGHRGTYNLDYAGRVMVHDQLSLISGIGKAQSMGPALVWNNADLAVIFLDDAVNSPFEPMQLAASKEVELGSRIVMVGYGAGNSSHHFGDRQSGENVVTRLLPLETGSVLFRSELRQLPEGGPASYAEPGDSGGACVAKSSPNVLVGLVTANARQADGTYMSYFTSIYAHRSWLQAMLQQADKS